MRKLSLAVLAIFLLISTALWAQSDRATITGTVTDPSGALIPGVRVTATNVDTRISTFAVTNDVGLYSILNLPVGRYTVAFEKQDFQRLDRAGITLSVTQVAQVNAQLQMGAMSQTVTVTEEAPLLQTETTDVGTNLKGSVVTDLPLSIGGGRQIEQFAYSITPSVQGDYYQSVIAGGQTFSKEVVIDGTSATAQIQGGVFASAPSMEAVEEFRVETSGFRAENGRTGGGVFLFNLKSGTNSFHGSAFGYLHNEILDANTWQANHIGEERPKARFFQTGISAGGPIFKDKTFIFGAYEKFWLHDFRLLPPYQTVPTSEFLNGDFSQLLNTGVDLGTDGAGNTIYQGAIFDPLTGNVFPGNVIPSDRISAVSAAIADIYRSSYQPINSNLIQNNSLPLSNSPSQTIHQLSFKVDHNISNSDRLSGSWIYYKLPRTLADSGGIWAAGSEDGGPLAKTRLQDNVSNQWRLSHSHSFSPTMLNVLSLTYNEIKNYSISLAKGGNWPSVLGFGDTGAGNFPEIGFGEQRNGVYTDSIGNSYNGGFIGASFYLNESLSWVKGRHTFKFGGELRTMQHNSHSSTGALHFNFSPDQTGAPTAPYSTQVGFGFASFLLGAVSDASEDTPFDLYGRRKSMAMWAQDDFKVNNKLTLNLGLRWDVTFPFHEKYGHWANFDLNDINPALGVLGVTKYASSGSDTFESERDWKEFSPHVGLAYQLTNRAVLRGAYGINYSPIGINYWQGVPYGFAPGFRGTNIVTQNADFTPAFNWDAGYPGQFAPGTQDPNYITWGMVSVDPRSLKAGYTHQFNGGMQYELMRDLSVDVSYVGNLGRRLQGGTLDFNSPDWSTRSALFLSGHDWDWVWDDASAAAAGVPFPYPGFGGYAYQAIAPYPQLAAFFDAPILYVGTPTGKSDYNALQVEVTKRGGQGLSLDLSYTLARSRSNSIMNFGDNWWYGGLQDFSNLDREAQNYNPWDQRHVVKGYVAYELPFGRGRQFFSGANGAINALVGGWTISSVLRYGSGRPLGVYSSNWVPGWAAIYPNISPNADFGRKFDASNFNPDANGVPDPNNLYFDPTIFSNPAPGELGTALARGGQLRGFGDAGEDVGLLKYFKFGADDRYRLSLRLEFYNIFNRHGYCDPDTNITSATFGYVTCVTGNPRQGQLGARFQW